MTAAEHLRGMVPQQLVGIATIAENHRSVDVNELW